MLPKLYRLPANTRLKNSFSFSTPLFILKIGKNNLDYSRFAFVVSKKVDQRATARNRIKRLLRSCIEEIFSEIQIGYDMIFFLKAELLEMKRKELYNQVYGFLKEKKLLA